MDTWIECPCGNDPEWMGFATTINGKIIEPTLDSEWAGEYQCMHCGKLFSPDN
jgi:hypothetical protein